MHRAAVERVHGTGVGGEHGFDLGAQPRIARTQLCEPGFAIRACQVRNQLEYLQNARDLRRGFAHWPISASSKARALRQSRRTV